MPVDLNRVAPSLAGRFWAKVSKSGACWLWIGARDHYGYGKLHYSSGVGKSHLVKAHRVAYRLLIGPLREGEAVCHSCDVPACVNPGHLFQTRPANNARDMWTKGRARIVALGGEVISRPKLTDETVAALRQRYRDGVSTWALAREFGVSQSTAWAAAVGHTWHHLPQGPD